MRAPYSHIRHQLPVISAILRAGWMTARSAGRKGEPPPTPSPLDVVTLPPRPKALVDDYLRCVGGSPSAYGDTIPAHLFPQWCFPQFARQLEQIPWDLRKVLNGGARLELRKPLPAGEPLTVAAQLAGIDVDERRAVLHQVATTGTLSAPEAVVGHLYAIVPLARGPKGGEREKPTVGVGAREIDRWRLPADAGLEFAVLTGDFNPVHWLRPAARAAGFKGCILHGYASLARAIESLNRAVYSGDVTRLASVDVRFVRPLVLPGEAGVFLERLPEGDTPGAFSVGDAPGGPAWLTGIFTLHPA